MTKIIVKDREDLKKTIQEEIEKHGNHCDLNHIDVSLITNMSFLFEQSHFNGDISQWNTSKVTDMSFLFDQSQFNGDISNWNTENVISIQEMFNGSQFNGDISQWNVFNVENMVGCLIEVFSMVISPNGMYQK